MVQKRAGGVTTVSRMGIPRNYWATLAGISAHWRAFPQRLLEALPPFVSNCCWLPEEFGKS
jgi:hypothetical protein